jgi:hypothetical protein
MISLGTLKISFFLIKRDSLWVRPRTCTTALLQMTRAIGEYN